jgi:hypothetical protein
VRSGWRSKTSLDIVARYAIPIMILPGSHCVSCDKPHSPQLVRLPPPQHHLMAPCDLQAASQLGRSSTSLLMGITSKMMGGNLGPHTICLPTLDLRVNKWFWNVDSRCTSCKTATCGTPGSILSPSEHCKSCDTACRLLWNSLMAAASPGLYA